MQSSHRLVQEIIYSEWGWASRADASRFPTELQVQPWACPAHCTLFGIIKEETKEE